MEFQVTHGVGLRISYVAMGIADKAIFSSFLHLLLPEEQSPPCFSVGTAARVLALLAATAASGTKKKKIVCVLPAADSEFMRPDRVLEIICTRLKTAFPSQNSVHVNRPLKKQHSLW